MNLNELREIVKLTVDELYERKLLSDPYSEILKITERKLYKFFNSEGDPDGIGKVLKRFSDDAYIDVIYMQYRDGKTIECIAGEMDRSVSTVLRNKKRIVNKIYEHLIDCDLNGKESV